MEAGKERLSSDTVSDATRQEVQEAAGGRAVITGAPSQRNGDPDAVGRRPYQRMSTLRVSG